MWEAKCLRWQSRLENVGSHTKARFLYLSCAAAGQSCAGLGTGRRWQLKQEQVAPCPAPSARSAQWCLDPKASLQEELTSLHILLSLKPSWSKTHSYFCLLLSALQFHLCFWPKARSETSWRQKNRERSSASWSLYSSPLISLRLQAILGEGSSYWKRAWCGWYVLWEKLRSWKEMLAIIMSKVSADTSSCFYLKLNHLLL